MTEEDETRWRILVEKMASDIELVKESTSQIPGLVEDVATLKSDVTEVKGKLIVHEQILREHSADIREIKGDVKELKQIVAQHSKDITELKIDVKEIKDAVVGVQATSHTHA